MGELGYLSVSIALGMVVVWHSVAVFQGGCALKASVLSFAGEWAGTVPLGGSDILAVAVRTCVNGVYFHIHMVDSG